MTHTDANTLLREWSALTREYSRTAVDLSRVVSVPERAWLTAALEDVKEQASLAMLAYKDHLKRDGQVAGDR